MSAPPGPALWVTSGCREICLSHGQLSWVSAGLTEQKQTACKAQQRVVKWLLLALHCVIQWVSKGGEAGERERLLTISNLFLALVRLWFFTAGIITVHVLAQCWLSLQCQKSAWLHMKPRLGQDPQSHCQGTPEGGQPGGNTARMVQLVYARPRLPPDG